MNIIYFNPAPPNKVFVHVGGLETSEHKFRKMVPDGMLSDDYFVTLAFAGFIPPDIHRTRLRLLLTTTTQLNGSIKIREHARHTSCHVGCTFQGNARNQSHVEKGGRYEH